MESPLAPPRGFETLDRAWGAALDELPASGPLVVLFSGGVDSGLLAWEVRHRPGTRLATAGVAGGSDLPAAARAATQLGLPWTGAVGTPTEVRALAQAILAWEGPLPAGTVAIQTAFALAMSSAPEGVLLCGQGADELFFGYAHFRGLEGAALTERASLDLDRLLRIDWPMTCRVARHLGRDVRAPYLNPGFREAAELIAAPERNRGPEPKGWFRAWARSRGLPEEIAGRPKKALQYGSGVDRLLGERSSGP